MAHCWNQVNRGRRDEVSENTVAGRLYRVLQDSQGCGSYSE